MKILKIAKDNLVAHSFKKKIFIFTFMGTTLDLYALKRKS